MPPRILIADDNPTFRKALRHLLESADQWEIIEARDGQEAVTKAAEMRPDVILLDLAMPGKDGFAAAREIAALLPAVPILMCTMHMSPHIDSEARKFGIRKVLSKTDSLAIVPALRQCLSPPKPILPDSVPEAVPPPVEANAVPTPPPPSTPPANRADPVPALPKNAA